MITPAGQAVQPASARRRPALNERLRTLDGSRLPGFFRPLAGSALRDAGRSSLRLCRGQRDFLHGDDDPRRGHPRQGAFRGFPGELRRPRHPQHARRAGGVGAHPRHGPGRAHRPLPVRHPPAGGGGRRLRGAALADDADADLPHGGGPAPAVARAYPRHHRQGTRRRGNFGRARAPRSHAGRGGDRHLDLAPRTRSGLR